MLCSCNGKAQVGVAAAQASIADLLVLYSWHCLAISHCWHLLFQSAVFIQTMQAITNSNHATVSKAQMLYVWNIE